MTTKKQRHPGMKPVQIWLTPEQYKLIKRASSIADMPMVKLVKRGAIMLATARVRQSTSQRGNARYDSSQH